MAFFHDLQIITLSVLAETYILLLRLTQYFITLQIRYNFYVCYDHLILQTPSILNQATMYCHGMTFALIHESSKKLQSLFGQIELFLHEIANSISTYQQYRVQCALAVYGKFQIRPSNDNWHPQKKAETILIKMNLDRYKECLLDNSVRSSSFNRLETSILKHVLKFEEYVTLDDDQMQFGATNMKLLNELERKFNIDINNSIKM